MLITWFVVLLARAARSACPVDRPPTWPKQFVLVQRRIPDAGAPVSNATTVTYYDWDAGANLILITPDADESDLLIDLELNSGHSYYASPRDQTCKKIQMPVGILRPDWLVANATFLGASTFLGRAVVGWTKADFIDYYADAETCEPVSWYFHSMKARFDTLAWIPNQPAPNGSFKPPAYCGETTSAQ
ncbi:hypothetical protein M885DRAFT_516438 [Pelagophyceae sp. CCMP2097]|nr:hypothetical protein M885DRAFT_516438 [Pelagophyceae sp. CCMP2097]